MVLGRICRAVHAPSVFGKHNQTHNEALALQAKPALLLAHGRGQTNREAQRHTRTRTHACTHARRHTHAHPATGPPSHPPTAKYKQTSTDTQTHQPCVAVSNSSACSADSRRWSAIPGQPATEALAVKHGFMRLHGETNTLAGAHCSPVIVEATLRLLSKPSSFLGCQECLLLSM